MKINRFFSVLETASSEVGRRDLFKTWSTIYIPDYFLLFFFVTSFCLSVFSDIFILFFIILYEYELVFGIIVLITILPRVICEFFVETKCQSGFHVNGNFQQLLNFLGFRSIVILAKILTEIQVDEKITTKPMNCFSFPVFHISNENLSLIKIYCCINSAVKSVPQLYVMTLLILDHHVCKVTAFMATGSILLNMILFSFTISITFPIRKSPRVFTTTVCLVFSAINKFMAAMCACCVNLALFASVFPNLGYLTLPIFFVRALIWAWPCWQVLKCQPIRLTVLPFGIYFVFLTLLMSFIYIHPFEGRGKLYYYFFNLVTILADLFTIYLYTDANLKVITFYYTQRILMIGFLSCFGLLNILHKHKEEKYGCVPILNIISGDGDDADDKENKMEENVKEEKDDNLSIGKSLREDEIELEHQETQGGISLDRESRIQEISSPKRRLFRFFQFKEIFSTDASQKNLLRRL